MPLPVNTELGNLKLVKDYEYFDSPDPKLFTAINHTGQHWVAFWCDYDLDRGDGYVWVPISIAKLKLLDGGKISYNEALQNADYWYMVYDDNSVFRFTDTIDAELLPPPGYFVLN